MVLALIRAASANSEPDECQRRTPKPHYRRPSSTRQRRTTQKRLESKLLLNCRAPGRSPAADSPPLLLSIARTASGSHHAVPNAAVRKRTGGATRSRCGVARKRDGGAGAELEAWRLGRRRGRHRIRGKRRRGDRGDGRDPGAAQGRSRRRLPCGRGPLLPTLARGGWRGERPAQCPNRPRPGQAAPAT